MRTTILLIGILFLVHIQPAEAQLWDKIKKRAEDKIAEKAEQKADDILNGKKKKKKERRTTTSEHPDSRKNPNNTENKTPKNQESSTKLWRNYKFIPGENVIFYDDLRNEEIGEFPSRWDLKGGGYEIAKLNDEKAIIVTQDINSSIVPLFTKDVYLPDEFTLEFDIYSDQSTPNSRGYHSYNLSFFEGQSKTFRSTLFVLELSRGMVSGHMSGSIQLEKVPLANTTGWNHVALTYHKGKTKMYINEKRVLNVPRLSKKPGALSIGMGKPGVRPNGQPGVSAIKNFKIAEGGGSPYDRIMTDGKYVTNGILFDSGKSKIKPVSAGVINNMKSLMEEYPEWEFKIVGHTDSDGDASFNMDLSKKRAGAVKKALMDLGINSERLTIQGLGESKPLNNNSTSEEKANNRRVEFIKV